MKLLLLTSSNFIVERFSKEFEFDVYLKDIRDYEQIIFEQQSWANTELVVIVRPEDYRHSTFLYIPALLSGCTSVNICFITNNDNYSDEILKQSDYYKYRTLIDIVKNKETYFYLNDVEYMINDLRERGTI
jgi:PhoPQ-activated pathogenicity-related protein